MNKVSRTRSAASVSCLIVGTIVLFFYMALETWGMAPKSQTDPETIEQAIARLIAEHEASPTAHLGPGEALEAHRANEVIDHPAGSLRGDKVPFSEGLYFYLFESLDSYTKSATGVTQKIGGFKLTTAATLNDKKYVFAAVPSGGDCYNYERDVTMQFTLYLQSSATREIYAVAGGDGIENEGPGIGFKIVGNALYAVQVAWTDNGMEESTTLINGVTITGKHTYRIQQDGATGAIVLYMDGSEVAQMTAQESIDVGLVMWTFTLKTTAASTQSASVSGVYLSINKL